MSRANTVTHYEDADGCYVTPYTFGWWRKSGGGWTGCARCSAANEAAVLSPREIAFEVDDP